MRQKFRAAGLVLAVSCLLAPTADAAIFKFRNVTNDTTYAGSNLQVTTTHIAGDGDGDIQFKFENLGTTGAITDIYFDDGDYLQTPGQIVQQTSGVDFSFGAAPHAPPQGHPEFAHWESSHKLFSADSNPPAGPNGIDPGESVTVQFGLLQAYAIAIGNTGLNSPVPTSPFRIALHVQRIGKQSDWYILETNPPPGPDDPTVPEPATLAIWGLGLGIAGLVRLRRKS